MKRSSIASPDDLAIAVDARLAQENQPALTTVLQAALREYLKEQGYLREYKPLRLTPVGHSGRTDVSIEHDAYLAGVKK